jgi:ubiquinone/menaquinone biosynthesis C-methylase UbiE
MMDDPDCDPEMLATTLHQIAQLNKLAGAHSIFRWRFLPILQAYSGEGVSILDVGTGIGDIPVRIVRWCRSRRLPVSIVATDLRRDIVDTASKYADRMLDPQERTAISHEVADVFSLPYPDNQFDITIANQVLHHFSDDEIPIILLELDRVSKHGVFIEDLQRHWIAYVAIKMMASLLRMTLMIKTDGPTSVRSGFKRSEIEGYFRTAGLPMPAVRWHPTFRWTVNSIRRISDV